MLSRYLPVGAEEKKKARNTGHIFADLLADTELCISLISTPNPDQHIATFGFQVDNILLFPKFQVYASLELEDSREQEHQRCH
jgi:DTW domain-containing protein YfiP